MVFLNKEGPYGGSLSRRGQKSRSLLLALLFWLLPLSSAPAQPVVIEDDLGRNIVFAAPARRIVVLSDLGAQLVTALKAEDLVVGRARWVDWPSAIAARPHLGLQSQPNLELLLRWEPDLVIADAHFRQALPLLETYRLPAVIFQGRDLPQLKHAVASLSLILARPREGERLLTFISSIENMLRQGLEGKSTLKTLMLFCAKGPPYYDMLHLQPLFYRAGITSLLENIETKSMSGVINPEWLLRTDAPLNILVEWRPEGSGADPSGNIELERPELAELAARDGLKIMGSRWGFNLASLAGLMGVNAWAHPEETTVRPLREEYWRRLEKEFLGEALFREFFADAPSGDD
ncbi:MAG: ABC transporter substrate-binding protein [Desulfarculales bacterium]|nr:ABC transporter substrate-binding protein [Desulfarculales bacterium]